MTIRASVILAFGLCLTPAFAQTLPGRNTGNAEHPRRQQQGFAEYALGKVNPGNADLGASYQAARDQLVEGTLDDFYFWSNCVSLTLLVGVTGFCFLNLRASDKKERIAATLIAQMWNGRVSDKVEIERRTEAYNALVDSHNELIENSLAPRNAQRKRQSTAKEEPEMEGPAIEMEPMLDEVPAPANPRVAVVVEEPAPTETPAGRIPPQRKPEGAAPSSSKNVATESQATAWQQEVRQLKSQVQALQSREANLLVRLNTQEEFKNRKQAVESKPGS